MVEDLARASGLSLDEAHGAMVNGCYQTSNPSARWFSRMLSVTTDEASEMHRWQAAGQEPDAPGISRRTTGERRVVMFARIEELGGTAPSIRAMAEYLTVHGFPITIAAVGQDYKKFDLSSGLKAGRRRTSGEPSSQLSLDLPASETEDPES